MPVEYIKALHIIFVVTWFAGLFYACRLLVYRREIQDRPAMERDILQVQLDLMTSRLWYGIAWPSAVLTFIFGHWILVAGGWHRVILQPYSTWLLAKYILVWCLLGYQLYLQRIVNLQNKGNYTHSSTSLRIWNEVATLFLFAIVFLVVVKQAISMLWGIVALLLLGFIIFLAIGIYKKLRTSKN